MIVTDFWRLYRTRQRLRQMDGGIRVMADSEQQDLAIEVIDATDRTVQAMGMCSG